MNRQLLTWLCDPISKQPLSLEQEVVGAGGEIIAGFLVAPSGHRYPIQNGIPRFLPSEEISKGVESFGAEWNHFNFVDFKMNWLLHTVKNTFGSPEAFKGKLIVDAGGGSGSQTLWMLEAGAAHVIMLELSNSVDDVVQRNLRSSSFKNYDVIQCSIDAPPLLPGSLRGIVYCHNVIQHTPSVERTAKALHELLAPGGEFVFNCYPLNDQGLLRWIRFHLIYTGLRRILAHMPFGVILGYSRVMGVLRQVPVLGILLDKLGFCIRGDVPRASSDGILAHLKKKYRATVLNTFDSYGSHSFQHHKSDTEIRTLVAELQPDPSKVLNMEKYFTRPPPIGCALRVQR